MDPVDKASAVHWLTVARGHVEGHRIGTERLLRDALSADGALSQDLVWQALVRARSYAERGGSRVLLDTIERMLRAITEDRPALRLPERVRGVW